MSIHPKMMCPRDGDKTGNSVHTHSELTTPITGGAAGNCRDSNFLNLDPGLPMLDWCKPKWSNVWTERIKSYLLMSRLAPRCIWMIHFVYISWRKSPSRLKGKLVSCKIMPRLFTICDRLRGAKLTLARSTVRVNTAKVTLTETIKARIQ